MLQVQVPADRVISLLTSQLADSLRENSILKVQVEMITAEAEAARTALALTAQSETAKHAEDVTAAPYLPSVPEAA